MMQDYQDIPFLLQNGNMDLMPCPKRNIRAFLKRGLIQNNSEQELEGGIHIFPSDYFCPMDFATGALGITENTYSIIKAGWNE